MPARIRPRRRTVMIRTLIDKLDALVERLFYGRR